MNAKIIMSKCRKTKKAFGIRFEEISPKNWNANWTFKVSESSAKKEKYESEKIAGSFWLDAKYPGCPYCGGKSFYVCGQCGRLNCWDLETKSVTCAECSYTGEIGGSITELKIERGSH